MIQLEPVGFFSSIFKDQADAPRQGSLSSSGLGVIEFSPKRNFEMALQDLQGMEKIWLVFWMDKIQHWKPKVQPPRSSDKKSVFATRSPHRPNPIGLSCVTLVEVKGLKLIVADHDLLDKTPILDVKPYLPYADSFPEAKLGWIDALDPLIRNTFVWSELALDQRLFLEKEQPTIKQRVEKRLHYFAEPTSYNRVHEVSKNRFVLAFKQWRFVFVKNKTTITFCGICSGYRLEDRSNHPLHRLFEEKFDSRNSKCFEGI